MKTVRPIAFFIGFISALISLGMIINYSFDFSGGGRFVFAFLVGGSIALLGALIIARNMRRVPQSVKELTSDESVNSTSNTSVSND